MSSLSTFGNLGHFSLQVRIFFFLLQEDRSTLRVIPFQSAMYESFLAYLPLQSDHVALLH